MWTTRNTINRGAIVKTGVERSRKNYTWDHYMIGARINFTKLMGKVQIQGDRYTQRKRIVRCAVKASKETYKKIAEERWNTTKMRKLRNQATQLENRTRTLGRGGNAKQRKKLQKSMDKYMKAITKQMLTIESPMQGGTKQTK